MDTMVQPGLSLVKDAYLKLILHTEIDTYWDDISAGLDYGPEYWEDFSSKEAIRNSLKAGLMQGWLASDDGGVCVFVLTEIIEYPLTKVLRVLYIGGMKVDVVLPLLEYIEWWSIREGCSKAEVTGRDAWVKLLSKYGYSKTHVTVTKELTIMEN